MKKYIMETRASMKPYNNSKWWIDRDIIGRKFILANNVNEALKKYASEVNKSWICEISKNALKNKNPMFIDDKDGNAIQVGYVLTAKTEFDKGDYTGYSTQYIDLWVDIMEVNNAFVDVA